MQVACSSWDYDHELVDNTLVSRGNPVCSRRPLEAIADAVYRAGALAAMGVMSYFSERAGRKPVILAGVARLMLSTLGITFPGTYIMYIATRFLKSGCVTTVVVVSVTLLFEVSTDSRRVLNVVAAFSFGAVAAHCRSMSWSNCASTGTKCKKLYYLPHC
ncbi:hypothetical protein HPB48_016247 [Haemaphysalis longicornis]|uniref:Major facilitator superfamily (MFS) profile domain-containing protein n=1 Tax=Haemaphysalis longicornis TaxID=44386 RepID=A0A9J6GGU9_HAELO|nr:hypothetical protein HPB48_016247 [Haemaphysalis longicornis]